MRIVSTASGRGWLAFFLGILLTGIVLQGFPAPVHADNDKSAEQKSDDSGGRIGEDSNPVLKWIEHLILWSLYVLPFILLTIIVWLLLDLRSAQFIPVDFVEEFEDALNKRKFKEAFELAKSEYSMIGRVLTAGMTRLQYGLEEGRDAANAMTDSLKTRKDHVLSYLATIGTLGPLMGLVGTVLGMIMSFSVLGQATQNPNPKDLASGISVALRATLLGIALSLPAIFFYSFFRNRVARIAIDANLLADDLLTQMYHSSRRPETAAAPATKPATAAAASATQTIATPTKQ